MMRHLLLVPALLFASPALAQHASDEDSAAVLATIDTMFAALTAKDPAALTAVTLPEGNATAAVHTPGGTPRIVTSDWASFAQRLPGIPGTPIERNIDPHVHVDGDIAMVWTPYVFTLDGKPSHCGTNHFDLVRKDGAWRVLNVTWTQRTQGCPAAE
ncbi:nuclear transport factor 2 family protein [Sphingosinithalassobacter sp. CS137]|uniref:nuclear transport factor 2 family protein n=1 Tax=Sphingosinithalassobacter sp. CS137 TaxID=2762748 RepID=UPI00165D6FF5|nr:nuclear transport factor 2 family protein [Sphingosinithalassobacter sp. CS137]